jgi:hypothetical protein
MRAFERLKRFDKGVDLVLTDVSQKKIERSRTKAPAHSSAIGMKGLTVNASCDSSVAIAPAK